MGKTITLPDDLYQRLEQQASVRGIGVPELIAELERALEGARLEMAVEAMRASDVLLAPREPPSTVSPEFEPITVRGKPVSETIIDERR